MDYSKFIVSNQEDSINLQRVNVQIGLVQEIWYLLHNAQMSLTNPHGEVSSKARCPNFGQSLHLHPYFMNEKQ